MKDGKKLKTLLLWSKSSAVALSLTAKQWSRPRSQRKQQSLSSASSAVAVIETSDAAVQQMRTCMIHVYHPNNTHKEIIKEWGKRETGSKINAGHKR